MNKFLSLISDNTNKSLVRRASSVAVAAEIAQQNLVNELKSNKTALELKVNDLTDFAPNSKHSLRPGCAEFNPKEWVEELQKVKEELYEVKIALQIAEETYNEFFTEIE